MRIPLLENIKVHILNPIISLLFVLALVVFLYGVAQYLWNSGSEEQRQKGRSHMIYGILGMFIMVSAIGIVNLICKTIGAC